MNYLNFEIVVGLLILIFIRILPLLFYFFIIRIIVNSIRRVSSRKYFKNNVVTHSDENINNNTKDKNNVYFDVSKSKLEMFKTDDIDALKDYFYDIFIKFETAYNNLDYNLMRMLSTKQLFQNYYTGITLDLQVGKKRIINDIKKKNVIIYELDSTIAKQTVSAMIEISYYNYIIDRKGNIVSGSRDNPTIEKFEVTFRKDFNKDDISKCPNCGANITGNKCEYCRTIIKNEVFKISNIKRIIE